MEAEEQKHGAPNMTETLRRRPLAKRFGTHCSVPRVCLTLPTCSRPKQTERLEGREGGSFNTSTILLRC